MSEVKNAMLKEDCRACNGSGTITDGSDANDPYAMEYTCPVCDGYGEVDPDLNMTIDRYDKIHKVDRRTWLQAADAAAEGKEQK